MYMYIRDGLHDELSILFTAEAPDGPERGHSVRSKRGPARLIDPLMTHSFWTSSY